jgi:hypothetical protein
MTMIYKREIKGKESIKKSANVQSSQTVLEYADFFEDSVFQLESLSYDSLGSSGNDFVTLNCLRNSLPIHFHPKDEWLENLKEDRLQILDPFIANLNCCDIAGIYRFLENKCDPNVVLISTDLSSAYYGIRPLFIFWNLLRELHPDGVFKILESRILLPTRPKSDSLSHSMEVDYQQEQQGRQQDDDNLSTQIPTKAEFIFKLSGTQFTEESVMTIFERLLLSSEILEAQSSLDISLLTMRVLHQLLNNQNSSNFYHHHYYNNNKRIEAVYIVELIITFSTSISSASSSPPMIFPRNDIPFIISWSYNILATNVTSSSSTSH